MYEGKCKLNCISGDGNTDNEHTEPKVIPCNSLRLDVAEVKIIAWDETLPMASRNDSEDMMWSTCGAFWVWCE